MSDVFEITARAHALTSHLALRELPGREAVANNPLTVRGTGGGHLVVFRFGAAVTFGMDPAEEAALLEELGERASDAWEKHGREEVTVRVDPDCSEGADAQGRVQIQALDVGRMQVVANVLAKSAALSYYEERVTGVFDQVEALAERLRRARRATRTRKLLGQIGDVLVTQARMVGRVEVSEKPEMAWDAPILDRLYERLAVEFELRDRDRALSRKLELISDIAGTYLDLIHNRQSLRLEWYIVLLIVFDICLGLWEKFWPH